MCHAGSLPFVRRRLALKRSPTPRGHWEMSGETCVAVSTGGAPATKQAGPGVLFDAAQLRPGSPWGTPAGPWGSDPVPR